MGSRPFFSAFCLKMSANDAATTARNPKSASAHGACSRELPQPKFHPATSTRAVAPTGVFRMNSGRTAPSASARQSANRCAPSPVRLVVFRKRAGMIWSVSMLSRPIATAGPSNRVSGSRIVLTRTSSGRRRRR